MGIKDEENRIARKAGGLGVGWNTRGSCRARSRVRKEGKGR